MNSKRLVFSENIKRCYKAVKGIRKLPVVVYSFVFIINGLNAKIERFNKFERNFLETFFFKSWDKKFKNKSHQFLFATQGVEFHFDPFEGLHNLEIKINFIAKEPVQDLVPFLKELKDIFTDTIGGKVIIYNITLDKQEEIMHSIVPYSSFDDNLTFEELSYNNSFPQFYTIDFFDFIYEPIKVIPLK